MLSPGPRPHSSPCSPHTGKGNSPPSRTRVPKTTRPVVGGKDGEARTEKTSPWPDYSPIRAPKKVNASFLPNKFLFLSPITLSCFYDKFAVLRQCKPEERVLEKLEYIGGQPGAKAKLFRPGVSSGFISHHCLCSAHFFFQKVGVMMPTLGTVVLEKER